MEEKRLTLFGFLWDWFKEDWGITLGIAIPIFSLIGFFVWYENKADAEVHKDTIRMEEKMDAIYHLEYRGHKYIWVVRYNRGGLVHDPDCPCGSSGVKRLATGRIDGDGGERR